MIIGVTGGIGSGKTTVSGLFEKMSAFTVDADRVGREVAEDQKILSKLVEAFGPDILDQDGKLVRRKLGRLAFSSPKRHQKLNEIVHPPLVNRLWKTVEKALDENPHRPVVIDAALIVEWGELERFDVLVVVAADEDKVKERFLEDTRLSAEEVDERLRAQLPLREKLQVADYVIYNNGSTEDLGKEVSRVWNKIMSQGG